MQTDKILNFPISQAAIAEMARHSADPLAIVDLDVNIVWANRAFRDLLQVSEENLLDNLHQKDAQMLRAFLDDPHEGYVGFRARVREGGEWLRVEFSVVKDGARYYVACHTSVGHRDREIRLRRQVRLMALAEKYAALGHWRVDLRDDSVHWSPVIYEIHGVDESFELSLESATGFFPEEDRERLLTAFNRAIETRTGYEMELNLIRPDGTRVRTFTKGTVEVDRDNEPIGVFGIFQDITEREREIRRRAHNDRLSALGTLAAGLAHEINNPLAFMSANLDYALDVMRRVGSGEVAMDEVNEATSALEEALSGSQRVASIVSSLRSFGAAPSAQPVEFDLAVLIQDAVDSRRGSNSITYKTDFTVPYAGVTGDGAVISRVLDEVIDNAEHALATISDREPKIGVYLRAKGDFFSIEVVDNGVGMSDDVREQAFEPFFSTRDVDEGKGLGLSSCLGIVNSLGGSIELHSRVGVGTTVSMTFPAATQPASTEVTEVDPGEKPPHSTKDLVFLVDDEPLVGRAIKRTLGRFFEVELYNNADDALDAIARGAAPAAIVCDIMMPGRTGLELHAAVEEVSPELAAGFIFLSGGAFSGNVEERLEAIAAPRLTKPFIPAELRDLVEERVAASKEN